MSENRRVYICTKVESELQTPPKPKPLPKYYSFSNTCDEFVTTLGSETCNLMWSAFATKYQQKDKITYSFSLSLVLPLLVSSISTGSLAPNS